MTGPSTINVTYSATNIHCFGGSSGGIKVNVAGGVTPYAVKVTGPNNYQLNGQSHIGLYAGNYDITVVDAVGSAATQSLSLITENPQLLINKPNSQSVISKQCDKDNYKIPFTITAGPTNSVEYSLDNFATAGLSPTATNFTYLDPYYYLTIPKDSVNYGNGISIRTTSNLFPRPNVKPCYSNVLTYSVPEVELPPSTLAIKDSLGSNYTPANEAIYHNRMQCNASNGTYIFSINQLDSGYTTRAPYTIDYKVENINATAQQITHYNGLVTLTGVKNTNIIAGPVDNKVDFYVRVTDNKGCTYPANATDNASTWYKATVTLPTTALSTAVTHSGPNGGNYTHTLIVNGGFPPYTIDGQGNYQANQPYTFSSTIPALIKTLTDSNGCTLNIIQ